VFLIGIFYCNAKCDFKLVSVAALYITILLINLYQSNSKVYLSFTDRNLSTLFSLNFPSHPMALKNKWGQVVTDVQVRSVKMLDPIVTARPCPSFKIISKEIAEGSRLMLDQDSVTSVRVVDDYGGHMGPDLYDHTCFHWLKLKIATLISHGLKVNDRTKAVTEHFLEKSFKKLQIQKKWIFFNVCCVLLFYAFLCCSVCLFVYGPFCHGDLIFDMSTLFTTFFLWTSLQLISDKFGLTAVTILYADCCVKKS